MPNERFMRHHYGAGGYVKPGAAYEAAYTAFESYWQQQPTHVREDQIYRAIAAQAYIAAKGFNLGDVRSITGF